MKHAKAAKKFLDDKGRSEWHDDTLWFIREKRDISSKQIPEWEQLRELASQIKNNVLSDLDNYLIQFEENAQANGAKVYWAKDAAEHNEIVNQILKQHKASNIVKSKSILTEECHLNHFLENQGFEVMDTDLGERILQMAKQSPSHIVLPAIHLKKGDVGALFHKTLNTDKGAEDPQYLTEAARKHLRSKFIKADVAITGVNFAVAETGGLVVCTNEGNADIGVNLAPVHIACMGIEKIIPKAEHLGVFLRLLARSATGQSITNYTSHFNKPRQGAELHIILVDNGRTNQLGCEKFRNSLKCIRCGACMNTCPIYRRSGGYSYDATIPGPIGSILSPGLDLKKHSSLPFASTLCGSCSDVCPVKINIHEQLYEWRQEIAKAGELPSSKSFAMKATGYIFSKPALYRTLGKFGKALYTILPKSIVYNRFNTWGKSRELPLPPKQSFREWYLKNKGK